MKVFKSYRDKIQKDPHFVEILKGSGIAFFLRGIGQILSYIFLFLITRYYGAKGVGIFALSLVFLNISSAFAKGGLNTAFLRFVSEFSKRKEFFRLRAVYKKVLSLAFLFSVLSAICMYFFSPFLANILHKPYLSPYFKIMSIGVIPLVFFSINAEGLRGLKRIKDYVLLSFFWLNLFAILFLLGLIFFDRITFFRKIKPFSPEISYVLSVLIVFILSFFMFFRFVKVSETDNSEEKGLSYSEILNVSLPMLVSGSLFMILGWVDTIMLGWLGSVSDVGIYNVAMKISRVAVVFLVAVNTIAAPKFAEFYAVKDFKSIARVAKQASKLIFFLTFPFVIIILAVPYKILFLFGKDFVKGKIALIILIIGFMFNAISGSVGNILQMTGNQVYHRNVLIAGTLLNIFLNYTLIPVYGLNGAAIASTISMIFWNFMFLLKVKKITGEWVFYPQINKGE